MVEKIHNDSKGHDNKYGGSMKSYYILYIYSYGEQMFRLYYSRLKLLSLLPALSCYFPSFSPTDL